MIAVRVEQKRPQDRKYRYFSPWSLGLDPSTGDLLTPTWIEALPPHNQVPMYGVERLKKKGHQDIFIHSSPTTVSKLRRLLKVGEAGGLDAHPWQKFLTGGRDPQKPVPTAHLSWLGGATDAYFTDFSILSNYSIGTIYIVPSLRDSGAQSSLDTRVISNRMPGHIPVYSINWTNEFGDGFDLGSEWPDMVTPEYVAPDAPDDDKGKARKRRHPHSVFEYTSMLQPATWATEVEHYTNANGNAAKRIHIRKGFNKVFSLIQGKSKKGEAVCLIHPRISYSYDAFNTLVRPFSTGSRAEIFTTWTESVVERCHGFTYLPGLPPGPSRDPETGKVSFNIYEPPQLPTDQGGDPGLFLEYISSMIPNPVEARFLLRWIATVVARPEVHMEIAVLLTSDFGAGKTTLGQYIMPPLVGTWNFASPDPHDFENNFNSWARGRKFVFMDELKNPENIRNRSFDLYENLKAKITNPKINVEIKFKEKFSIPNKMQFMASSNEAAPLRIPRGCRRWFVPTVNPNPKFWSRADWARFYRWLFTEGGILHINQWCHEYTDPQHSGEWWFTGSYISKGKHAPPTAKRSEMSDNALSEQARVGVRLLEHLSDLRVPAAIDLQRLLVLSAAASPGRRQNNLKMKTAEDWVDYVNKGNAEQQPDIDEPPDIVVEHSFQESTSKTQYRKKKRVTTIKTNKYYMNKPAADLGISAEEVQLLTELSPRWAGSQSVSEDSIKQHRTADDNICDIGQRIGLVYGGSVEAEDFDWEDSDRERLVRVGIYRGDNLAYTTELAESDEARGIVDKESKVLADIKEVNSVQNK